MAHNPLLKPSRIEKFKEATFCHFRHGPPAQSDACKGMVHLVRVAHSLQYPILIEGAEGTYPDDIVEFSFEQTLNQRRS